MNYIFCAHASKFDKLFPAWTAEEESRILVQFCHGNGPNQEDVKMFKLVFMRLKMNREKLVEDVHWAYYPSDILLHNNVIIATII